MDPAAYAGIVYPMMIDGRSYPPERRSRLYISDSGCGTHHDFFCVGEAHQLLSASPPHSSAGL